MPVDTVVTENGFYDDNWLNKDVLVLQGDDDPDDALIHAQSYKKIIITFTNGHDGRGFSLARQLRDAGYSGHIRAKGPLVPDQWRHLRQTGFNDLVLTPDQMTKMPPQSWQDVQQVILPDYQHRIFRKS